MRDDGLAHQKSAREVETEDLVNELFGQLIEVRPAHEAARVVDQDVDSSLSKIDRLLNELVNVPFAGDIR